MNKFKVGDNVRILNEQSKISRGTIDTIIETGTSYSYDHGTLRTEEVTLYKLKNHPFYIFTENEIELEKPENNKTGLDLLHNAFKEIENKYCSLDENILLNFQVTIDIKSQTIKFNNIEEAIIGDDNNVKER